MAGGVLAEFKAACSCPSLSQSIPQSKWKAPPTGFIEINIDAAVFEDGRKSCISVAICDNLGEVLAASKAMALQNGVLLAAELEVSHAIFDSDALSIILAINDGIHGGELGHIIRNIREMAVVVSWCSFKHLKREGNRVAHELAKVAGISGVSQV